MRRLLTALLLAAGALSVPQASALPTPGFASPNVEFLANVPLHADTAGAHLRDGWLYVTSSHELTIYDVSTPELPVLTSTLPLPQMPYFSEEDVDTNGKVLLIGTVGSLFVFDVTDKLLPKLTSTLSGADEHTVTCVLDCTWAYGSYGAIVDLRNPAAPKLVGDWTTAAKGGPGSQHDVTEVAPGLVMTSTEAMWLLDARRDPAHPKVVARGDNKDGRFIHASGWPRAMKDRWLLVGGETAPTAGDGTVCSEPDGGAFMTYDTRGWARSRTLTRVDSYRPPASKVTDGGAAYETFCSHWFTTRPGWKDGGQLAVGWYEHGTRLLQVSSAGRIKEQGYYTPVGTSSSAAYWASKDILYILDYNRGLDVLRIHNKAVRSPIARGATGLLPTSKPLHSKLMLPGMVKGDTWRCGNPVAPLAVTPGGRAL